MRLIVVAGVQRVTVQGHAAQMRVEQPPHANDACVPLSRYTHRLAETPLSGTADSVLRELLDAKAAPARG